MTSSSPRTSYHTIIKYLARDGLLSSTMIQQIPRSNIYRWKTEPPNKYKSFDLNLQATADYTLIKDFIEHKTARRIFSAYVRIIKTLLTMVSGQPAFLRAIKHNSKQVIDIINRVRPQIGLMRALRFFNISVATFRQWSLQSYTQCFESLTNSCNRIFPAQLSRPQVTLLKELLLDPRFQFWPVSSIALYALRENILPLSLNTWYKYVHKLGINRPRSISRRKKSNTGIRAQHPHQIWHADITIFTTPDQIKHYIYCIVDNYSRKILSCVAHSSVRAEFRRDTILKALKNMNDVKSDITLITDGGPENNLKLLFDGLSQPIEHKKALVDIHYSNSLIEAHNKILKYNYLYRMDVRDGDQLIKALLTIVDNFNNRPPISLDGLTPNEAEQNTVLDRMKLSNNIKQSTLERKIYNQLHRCKHCSE